MGRILLDAFSETILSFVFFLLRFATWSMQWSLALVVFGLAMAGAGYYVYAFALEGGHHVSIPNIVDMPVTEAALMLTERGLDLGKQTQAPHPTIPKYYIIAQRPSAGRIVREGRRINVIVSMGQDYLRAPELVGKSLEEARREIATARFRVGSLARIPGDAARDTVLAQDPPPGGDLPDQGEIHLLVSAGADRPSALMPELRGRPIAEVEGMLEGFEVVIVANQVDTPDAAPDVVLSQNPAPDTLIYQGQVVSYEYRPTNTEEAAPSMRYEETVRHQMFYDWYDREVRVDVVDRMGNRQTAWSKAPTMDEASQRTYVTGTAIRVPIAYVVEAVVEVYIDGKMEASYQLKDGNPPVKTQ